MPSAGHQTGSNVQSNLSDDILVYGKTKEEHDKALKATFQCLRESGLTLHKQKCVYGKDKL